MMLASQNCGLCEAVELCEAVQGWTIAVGSVAVVDVGWQ
jgi:hypothetical protein